MGSFTHADQLHLDEALEKRNEKHEVSHIKKAATRADIELPGIHKRMS